jgi:hypothetical protein
MHKPPVDKQVDDDHHRRQAVLNAARQPGRIDDRQQVVLNEAAWITGFAGRLPEAVSRAASADRSSRSVRSAAPQQAAGRCSRASLGQRSTRQATANDEGDEQEVQDDDAVCQDDGSCLQTRDLESASTKQEAGAMVAALSEAFVETPDLPSGLLGGPTAQVAAGNRRELSLPAAPHAARCSRLLSS